MKKLIAYCGLDCETCDARIATLDNDNALREKTAKLWSEMNNTEITPEMINCEGCRLDGVKTPFCDGMCPIRNCAMGKKHETCGACSELHECPKVGLVISRNPEASDNLKNE